MRTTVIIDSLQCENCKSFLNEEIQKIQGISNIEIHLFSKSISFNFKTHNIMEGMRMHLRKINYPITYDPSIIKEDLKCISITL